MLGQIPPFSKLRVAPSACSGLEEATTQRAACSAEACDQGVTVQAEEDFSTYWWMWRRYSGTSFTAA